jgi:hypothetical protein
MKCWGAMKINRSCSFSVWLRHIFRSSCSLSVTYNNSDFAVSRYLQLKHLNLPSSTLFQLVMKKLQQTGPVKQSRMS